MKALVIGLGVALVAAGLWLGLVPLRAHTAGGSTVRCGPSLVRVVQGRTSGPYDTSVAFVVFGAIAVALGVAIILFAVFLAHRVIAAWHRAVSNGRAANA